MGDAQKEEFAETSKNLFKEQRLAQLLKQNNKDPFIFIRDAYKSIGVSVLKILVFPFGVIVVSAGGLVYMVIYGVSCVIDLCVNVVLLAGMNIEALLNLIFRDDKFKFCSTMYARMKANEANDIRERMICEIDGNNID